MLFLIDYDRNRGKIVSMQTFENSDLHRAQDTRLDLEMGLDPRGLEREVVLLDAASEEVLRRTHRRYFEDLAQLVS